MHVRKPNIPCTSFTFNFGKNYGTPEFPTPSNKCITLEYTSTYKYLGVLFSEHLDFNILANDLSARASRALGSLISKYYINKYGCTISANGCFLCFVP